MVGLADAEQRIRPFRLELLERRIDRAFAAEGRGRLQEDDIVEALPGRFVPVERVRHDRLGRRSIGGEVSGPDEGHVGAIGPRRLRDCLVVSGDHHVVDPLGRSGGEDRPGDEGFAGELPQILSRDALGAAACGDDGKAPAHRVSKARK